MPCWPQGCDFVLKVLSFYRCGPMRQISLVGAVHEEAGGYFPDILDMLEEDPFLKYTSPWGEMSCVDLDDRAKSNDGPILWIRPGEQMVPANDLRGSPMKRRRYTFFYFTIVGVKPKPEKLLVISC